MKVKYYFICLILSIIVLSPSVQAFNIAQNVCEYIAADDKKRLRKLLKTNHLKIRTIFDDITCNGQNILVFSVDRKSSEISDLIIKKLPKDVLQENLAAVSNLSPEFASVIQERIQ